MKLNEYQELAMHTRSDTYKNLVSASTMGLQIEASEVAELIHKSVHHHRSLNTEKLKDELGDVLWNIACLASFFEMSLQDVAQRNIDKLRERHGDKYNPNHYTDDIDTIVDGAPEGDE